jgi:chloramphenicol-sensitive protein RarD
MGNQRTAGILSAIGAYTIWGFLPIYWKLLQQVPALEILSHRLIWSLFFLIALLVFTNRVPLFKDEVRLLLANPRKVAGVAFTAALIALNWLIYIWAVNDSRIVETSLGYYINPLVNVLFGVALLKEKLTGRQKLAVVLAAAGVLNLVFHFGSFPWVAIFLAVSFALYGLCKKLLGLSATTGITLETFLITPIALLYLANLHQKGAGVFGSDALLATALLIGSGIVTALPMVLFANAANRLPLTLLGFFQYLSPTIALLVGVIVYGEPFTFAHAISFCLIWLALAVFSKR